MLALGRTVKGIILWLQKSVDCMCKMSQYYTKQILGLMEKQDLTRTRTWTRTWIFAHARWWD